MPTVVGSKRSRQAGPRRGWTPRPAGRRRRRGWRFVRLVVGGYCYALLWSSRNALRGRSSAERPA
eukprot:6587582-Lingulodinium_polyedra.AAC.1